MQAEVIALLGFGEGGSGIGRGLAAKDGWRGRAPAGSNRPRRLLAVDVALDQDARGRALGQRARELDIQIAAGYGEALRQADVVFSVVPGESALDAARAAAPFLKPGALYLDLCTISGPMAERDRKALAPAGVRYVDIAVMGSFLNFGHRAPMLLAGEDVEAAAAWMREQGFDVKVLGTKPGSASAVKLLRSVLMKGIEALGVECLVAAERQGLVKEVLDNIGDVDKMGFAGFVEMLVNTHVVHAKRRWEEMELVAKGLAECGVRPLMTQAIIASHARTVDARLAPADGKVPPLAQSLAILGEKAVGRL
ncbi:MAG: NAD(P)-dependent oxidoreductase [Alphaproteobacteria bacterium]|nr:NAD(P)-dependent oxidoreductase [Alphaproteobacteria bacterium]